jgi:hypothetical protein
MSCANTVSSICVQTEPAKSAWNMRHERRMSPLCALEEFTRTRKQNVVSVDGKRRLAEIRATADCPRERFEEVC